MSEHRVDVLGSRVGTIIIDQNALRAGGGADAPCLTLLVRVKLQAVREDPVEGGPQRPVTPISIVQATAFLNVRGIEEFAHAVTADVDLETLNWPQPVDGSVSLRFPLSAIKVSQIESVRSAGDIQFDFRVRLRLAMHVQCDEAREQQRSRGSYTGWRRSPVEHFRTATTQVLIDVPKSQWVKDFLPALGFGTRHVIELEVPPPPNDARFERALAHLNAASAAVAAGDAPAAMTRCWTAWETMVVEFLGEGRKPERDSFEALLVRARMPGAKVEKLKALLYDLAAFNHIGRHDRDATPMPVDIRDAEFAVLGTQFALGYLSRLGVFSPADSTTS